MTDTPDLRGEVEAALRGQIAALFRHAPGETRLGDEPPGVIADAVVEALPGFTRRLMSTVEVLRDRLGETTRERDEARAESANWQKLSDRWERSHQADVLPYTEELETEIGRLRREVEFEAEGETFWLVSSHRPRPCACLTPDDAAELRDLAVFSPPQCSVHPDSQGGQA